MFQGLRGLFVLNRASPFLFASDKAPGAALVMISQFRYPTVTARL